MKKAFELGVNFFDTAEVYSGGNAEVVMGKAVKDLKWDRSEVVLMTKIFFGTNTFKSPNARGLSRKHIIEGVDASLKRADLTYWDVVLCHRPDTSVPMEEIVRAYNELISRGKIFYWGTSEWSAQQIQEAITISEKLGLVARKCYAQESFYANLYLPLTRSFKLSLFFSHRGSATISYAAS